MGVNKNNILKAVFKSKDGVTWNELSEYLNEYTKDLLMELYENDMIEPHKNFMCGEEINTIEDGMVKLINWYESEGSTFEQRKAALPLHIVNVALPKCTNCGKLMQLAAFQCKCGVVKEA